MIIGVMLLEIYLPYSHSLKDKRSRMSSFKDRLKKKYNIAFSELDYQDKWQRTLIGIVTLNNHKRPIENLFNRIIKDAEENIDGEITHKEIHYQ
ncbi:MAG: DUF503 domain-containing protein [Candidatus Aminicenantes bacterium]|nr:DUF503 domain-containing protein [Candidatus Aminicenantes bacterium]